MTTFLPVDHAFAFDYLAILQVKQMNGLPVGDEIERVENFLKIQHPNMTAILASQEYQNLYCVNRSVFDAIDAAYKDEISASKVQEVNHKRFKAKQALQKRFWPKSKLCEKKNRA